MLLRKMPKDSKGELFGRELLAKDIERDDSAWAGVYEGEKRRSRGKIESLKRFGVRKLLNQGAVRDSRGPGGPKSKKKRKG